MSHKLPPSRPVKPAMAPGNLDIICNVSYKCPAKSDGRVPLFGLPDSACVNVPFHISQNIIKEVPPIPADENLEPLNTAQA